MINGNAPEVATRVGAAWRTVRERDPSLNGFILSGAGRTAARCREGVIERRNRGQER